LIDDQVAEGRYIEYKVDIPVSDEEQKRQRASRVVQPVDRSWVYGKSLMPFGRDKLLEELVAFANADGGVLILGIVEADVAPHHAAGFRPLPAVSDLERRLRDAIVNCVEPRLPHGVVKAIPLQDDGAGVVLLEVEPSRLGPHRVRGTREATIRREDSCLPMSMVEIHDMVLRNARRFDEVTARLAEQPSLFLRYFEDVLVAHCPPEVLPIGPSGRIHAWLRDEALAAAGFRVTLVPHGDLGIARLEHLAGLVPQHSFVQQSSGTSSAPVPGVEVAWMAEHGGHRVLGGVHQTEETDGLSKSYLVKRDGFVEATIVFWGSNGEVHAFVQWLVCLLACVFGVYERLRDRAGAASMPAEVGVGVLTRGGQVQTRIGGRSFKLGSVALDPATCFPRYTVSDRDSFSEVINEIAGDLANAGNLGVEALPKFHIV
jgi:hypothetical protein